MISDIFCSFHDFFRSFMKVGFPLPKVAEVESQPDHACINRRCSLISPNLHCACHQPQQPLDFLLPTLMQSKQFYYWHQLCKHKQTICFKGSRQKRDQFFFVVGVWEKTFFWVQILIVLTYFDIWCKTLQSWMSDKRIYNR